MMITDATSFLVSGQPGPVAGTDMPDNSAERAKFRLLLGTMIEPVADATETGTESGASVAPATVSTFAGVSEFGLMGWVMEQLRQKLEAEARQELMGELGIDEDTFLAMNYQEKQSFMAKLFERTEAKMTQALKDGALDKLRQREEKLYKLTPPPPEPNGDTGF